jgi:hypothetical protein
MSLSTAALGVREMVVFGVSERRPGPPEVFAYPDGIDSTAQSVHGVDGGCGRPVGRHVVSCR